MRIGINYGWERLEIEVPDHKVVAVQRQDVAPSVTDPAAAVRAALESPLGFPALRRALTPDDHIAIVVDETLPRLGELLTPLLEHVGKAGIPPEAITLVCPPHSKDQLWLDDLPEAYEEVRLEVHDPSERRHLAYLATTRRGRRVYLNRTVVDADQVVVLSGRSYDSVVGYGGGEAAIFPQLGDEATRREAAGQRSLRAPGKNGSGWAHEAVEVAWLLGAPFLVQVIEGSGGDIAHVIGGPVESSSAGRRLLDALWHVEVERHADLVVAAISGDPARHDLADLARALGCAARVVKPGGKIALLSQVNPRLGPSAEPLQAETPEAVLKFVHEHPSLDLDAAFLWASAAEQATVYVLSELPPETLEEMFAVPMEKAAQIARLVEAAPSCLVLPDAHRTMAVMRASSGGQHSHDEKDGQRILGQ